MQVKRLSGECAAAEAQLARMRLLEEGSSGEAEALRAQVQRLSADVQAARDAAQQATAKSSKELAAAKAAIKTVRSVCVNDRHEGGRWPGRGFNSWVFHAAGGAVWRLCRVPAEEA